MMIVNIKLVLAVCVAVVTAQQAPLRSRGHGKRPNIVFIMTDDQDLHMNSLDYMPLVQKYITEQGTSYQRHYCTTAICCPSRVSLLTGLLSHNTNVTDVSLPWGGYPKFVSQGFNEKYLPVWLQEANYNTYYTGKLMNSHTVDNYNKPYPAGWTATDFFLDPHTYSYLNVTTQQNQQPPVSWAGSYSTDVITEKAYGLLAAGIAEKDPFFLMICPIAPHSDIGSNLNDTWPMSPPIPAPRHAHLFPDAKVPRTPDFNPDQVTGASWIQKLDKLDSTTVAYNDDFYRRRLQTLQGVDELVEGVVQRLEAAGVLDNTYVIYSSDNGYHIGHHRLPPGKMCHFETDIHIPLIIRGPGIPKGKTTNAVTAHIDLAPTFLKIAGAAPRPEFDGSAIPLSSRDFHLSKVDRQEHVNVEYWGRSIAEGKTPFVIKDGPSSYYLTNNTYKALRIVSTEFDLQYAVWCSNEHELYDLKTDPHQINNLYPTNSTLPAPLVFLPSKPYLALQKLIPRLDALLMVTKSCTADVCREPWKAIHPKGDVRTLSDALKPKFDAFYGRVGIRIGFEKCEDGYIRSSEGEQSPIIFGSI